MSKNTKTHSTRTVWIGDSIWIRFCEIAKAQNTTRSALLRHCIHEIVDQFDDHKKKKTQT